MIPNTERQCFNYQQASKVSMIPDQPNSEFLSEYTAEEVGNLFPKVGLGSKKVMKNPSVSHHN